MIVSAATAQPPMLSRRAVPAAAAAVPRSAATAVPTTLSFGRQPLSSVASKPAASQVNLRRLGIKLVVCDMAGTTVEEHGLVYKVLRESMVKHGLTVAEHEMHPWHGAAKGAVVRHFLEASGSPAAGMDTMASTIDATFEDAIQKRYAQQGAVEHIVPGLGLWVSELHEQNIQIGLNTGYAGHPGEVDRRPRAR